MSRFSILRNRLLITGKRKTNSGFTFVEIMVTLIILSVGIVAVYQAFFVSLNQMSHLTSRLYVNIMLEDRIARIERTLRAYKALPFELDPGESVDIGVKTLELIPEMNIAEVHHFVDVFKVDVAYSWKENGKKVRLSRSAYISDYVTSQNVFP